MPASTADDVGISTPSGIAPAWLIDGNGEHSTTWAIHIHGLGSPRAGTLRGVQVATEQGHTSLVVSYRNDGEGPRTGTGRSILGATEADDVDAAIQYAIDHGARQIVLFGWSMGAQVRTPTRRTGRSTGRSIKPLVLESPVLDWVATIKANCARAGLPAAAGLLALPVAHIALSGPCHRPACQHPSPGSRLDLRAHMNSQPLR